MKQGFWPSRKERRTRCHFLIALVKCWWSWLAFPYCYIYLCKLDSIMHAATYTTFELSTIPPAPKPISSKTTLPLYVQLTPAPLSFSLPTLFARSLARSLASRRECVELFRLRYFHWTLHKRTCIIRKPSSRLFEHHEKCYTKKVRKTHWSFFFFPKLITSMFFSCFFDDVIVAVLDLRLYLSSLQKKKLFTQLSHFIQTEQKEESLNKVKLTIDDF